MFAEGANVGKIRAWLQQGGGFKVTLCLILINDATIWREWTGLRMQMRKVGAIRLLDIRIGDAELSVVH